MTANVGLRDLIHWKTFGLSTAEIGISEIIERLGKRVPEGGAREIRGYLLPYG